MIEVIWFLLLSTFRVSTPILFAALGGYFSERSGIINIALEGKMLFGAFAAAVVALEFGSPWAGFLAGAFAGAATAALYGSLVIWLRADQIVAGTGVNFLALGLTAFLAKVFYDTTASTPSVPIAARFEWEPPVVAWMLVLTIWAWARFTHSGLWVAFAGEHPQALQASGIQVKKTRWSALLMAGALAGLGGASLSIWLASSYTRGMTAGRGFMALAALILGKWRPIPTVAACLLFGFFDALQTRFQGIKLWGGDPVPVQFIQMLPYLCTIIVLAGFVGESRAPRALGVTDEVY